MAQEQGKQYKHPEIIIGLVAPLGSDEGRKKVIKSFKELFKAKDYDVEEITITKELFDFEQQNYPKSLEIYLKMEICTKFRESFGNDILAALAISKICKKRKEPKKESRGNGVVYIIDQLKHVGESDLLNLIYGENYIQISCFSSEENRNKALENLFKSDGKFLQLNEVDDFLKISQSINSYVVTEINKVLKKYDAKIRNETSSKLVAKDLDEEHDSDKKSGQGLAKLFDKSHYFINLDKIFDPSIENQCEKFVDLLFGKKIKVPTKHEFGMAIAYAASKRSTFPGIRHIGAAIVSEHGEVLAVASIRAPTPNANPSVYDQDKIVDGYNKFKEKKKQHKGTLDKLIDSKCEDLENIKKDLKEIKNFIDDSLEFHSTTHAEISAILDCAKMGISLRGATLYSTTFPCHLCAKDIVTAGIKKVVFIEYYPKSKNKELYPNIIEIDPDDKPNEKVGFYTFYGVGPRRYSYVYSDKNMQQENSNEEKNEAPILLRFREIRFYREVENAVADYFEGLNFFYDIEKNKEKAEKTILEKLFSPSKKLS